MKKIVVFIMIVAYSFAIQVKITPDKTIKMSNDDYSALKAYVQEVLKFHMSEKGARKIAKENRILANEYLKTKGLDKYDITKIKIMIETYLADKLIKDIQNNIKLPEKTLLSYYLDNKEQFRKGDTVDIISFEFDDMRKAIQFYNKVKDKDFDYAQKIADKEGVNTKVYNNQERDTMFNVIKKYVEKGKEKYFLPPITIQGHVKVMYVQHYNKSNEYYSFEEAKDKIKKKLFDETFARERNKILAKYKEAK